MSTPIAVSTYVKNDSRKRPKVTCVVRTWRDVAAMRIQVKKDRDAGKLVVFSSQWYRDPETGRRGRLYVTTTRPKPAFHEFAELNGFGL